MRGILTALSLGAFGVLTAAVIIAVGLTGSALVNANDSLGVVDAELTSVSGHADPLTYQVHTVNTALTNIEADLHPLSGQADTLNGLLSGTNSSLTSTDGLVKDVLAKAGPIEASLQDADAKLGLGPTGEANEVGSARATARVNLLNGQVASLIAILTPVTSDLSTIEALLGQTNTHLASACNQLPPPGGC